MNRTQDEIVARIEAVKPHDLFGFEVGDLVAFLDWAHAKKFLNGTEWVEQERPIDPRSLIRGYLPFAWQKANGCRGLSAMRSMHHMRAWLWLDGEDEACEQLAHFKHYGKEELRAISERYGFGWREHHDGRLMDTESSGIDGDPEPAPLKWKARTE